MCIRDSSWSIETGVFPYPIAIADPSVQKANSPNCITSLASSSSLTWRLVLKNISSPHIWILDFIGTDLAINLAVSVFLKLISNSFEQNFKVACLSDNHSNHFTFIFTSVFRRFED